MTTFKQRVGKWVAPLIPVNQVVFRTLRFEFNAFVTRLLSRYWPPSRQIIQELNQRPGISINLGSGGRGVTEWVNIDVMRHHRDQTVAFDIRRGLPFRDALADRIFAEHVIEHLEFRSEVPCIFAHCFRVLKPGCWLRVVVPDGQRWLQAYVLKDPELWKALGMEKLPADMPTRMAMINHVFHQGGEHHFAYDFETMHYLLTKAGFVDIRQSVFGTSADAANCLDREEHSRYSLYVDAQKPLE